MPASDLHERIRAEIEHIRLVDTHEHLAAEPLRLRAKIDLFEWIFGHYVAGDSKGAGMPPPTLANLRDRTRQLDARWSEFAPYWREVRSTGHGRALLLAARDLFGIDDLNDHTFAELEQRINAAYRPGWFHHVLKERANIDIAILDPLVQEDPTPLNQIDRRLFAPAIRMNDFVTLCNLPGVQRLESAYDVAIHCLDDILKAMDVAFERAVGAGVVAVKLSTAYSRTLHFEKVTHADADRVFARLFLHPLLEGDMPQAPPLSWAEAKPMQDFLMHQVVRRAIEHHLPLQIHTGLLAGGGNYVANANPLLLVNTLLEYREATFDLLHAGYPYRSELTTLGKYFSNVYVDLCWVHVLSPWVARQTLHEWIETIPANKILAFGGDYRFVEGTYAASRLARSQLAEVLAQKVRDEYLTEDEALTMATKLLRTNALRVFGLPG